MTKVQELAQRAFALGPIMNRAWDRYGEQVDRFNRDATGFAEDPDLNGAYDEWSALANERQNLAMHALKTPAVNFEDVRTKIDVWVKCSTHLDRISPADIAALHEESRRVSHTYNQNEDLELTDLPA